MKNQIGKEPKIGLSHNDSMSTDKSNKFLLDLSKQR